MGGWRAVEADWDHVAMYAPLPLEYGPAAGDPLEPFGCAVMDAAILWKLANG